MFPTCSMEQAQWVLAKARGNLEEAVQMLIEGKEEGPPGWGGPNQVRSFSSSPIVTPALLGLLVRHTPCLPSSLPLLLPLVLE